MDAPTIIGERLEAYGMRLREVMDDVTDEDLMIQPGPNDNPMGWLIWHMTRFEDRTFSFLGGTRELWIEGKWHERFGMEPDPECTGVGFTLEQVLALKVSKDALMGYFEAVREKTLPCLAELSAADLEREEIDFYTKKPVKLGLVLGRYLGDHLSHIGQICYLRGHIAGWGRYPV